MCSWYYAVLSNYFCSRLCLYQPSNLLDFYRQCGSVHQEQATEITHENINGVIKTWLVSDMQNPPASWPWKAAETMMWDATNPKMCVFMPLLAQQYPQRLKRQAIWHVHFLLKALPYRSAAVQRQSLKISVFGMIVHMCYMQTVAVSTIANWWGTQEGIIVIE